MEVLKERNKEAKKQEKEKEERKKKGREGRGGGGRKEWREEGDLRSGKEDDLVTK